MRSRREVLGLLGAGAAAGCAPLRSFPFDRGTPRQGDPLHIHFFSVACFLVEFRGLAVLTDPFFSHLPLGQVASGEVLPDAAQVDPYRHLLGNVRAMTVGHGHYDHLLDLPAVVGDVHPQATVVASATTRHIFAPLELPLSFVVANPLQATAETPGTWVEVVPGQLRVLPIASGHPDNIPGVHLFRRSLTADRETAPDRAHHYQEGATLAFLLDWLEGDRVACRVYVQTSSRGLPDGLFPVELLEERGVDVALLAMDCARAESSGRRSIQDVLRPDRVMFCHYADFFRPKDGTRHEGVKLNMRRLHRRLVPHPEREVLFPAWDSAFSFPLPPAAS